MTEDEEEALAAAYEHALALEKKRDPGAADAWRAVLALNPADPGGAAMRLASLGAADAPDHAPRAYVATLFDQHAEVFDGILVDQLEYGAPMLARERVQALGLGPFERMLDLGCGTGLAGEALEDMTSYRAGVDLAPGMIEIAGEKELYDRLFIADAVEYLQQNEDEWDLIIATDVLPYIGDPSALFAAAAAHLTADGSFIFTTETAPEKSFAGREWAVTPHQRFAHRESALAPMLAKAGLTLSEATDIMVRREQGEPIMGHLVIARPSPAKQ